MTQPKPRISNPRSRKQSPAPNRLFIVLALTAICLTLLWLPAEAQIRAGLAGAGQVTLGTISGADAVEGMACDPGTPRERCLVGFCVDEDEPCSTPAIPDLATVTSEFNIHRALLDLLRVGGCTIVDLNAAVELEHSAAGDLELRLQKVSGPEAVLLRPGDGLSLAEGRQLDVVFDDERNPPQGTYSVARPASPLSVFDGQDPGGVWRLQVADRVFVDSGRLINWGITFELSCSFDLSPRPCEPGPTTLCLNQDRFSVFADYRTPTGDSGRGRAVELTEDSGYFWFFAPDNVEVLVKVLNACSFADRFWVFGAGLTNVEVGIIVADSQSPIFNSTAYLNPLNHAFGPIQDTNALGHCP